MEMIQMTTTVTHQPAAMTAEAAAAATTPTQTLQSEAYARKRKIIVQLSPGFAWRNVSNVCRTLCIYTI